MMPSGLHVAGHGHDRDERKHSSDPDQATLHQHAVILP
jgi:hypothetical protein